MKLTFIGASGTVTGSSTLIEVEGKKFLVDCGMFQGDQDLESRNAEALPFNPGELTAVFITHAHLDHTGRLPLLTKNGFKGHIYALAPTIELFELILKDAAEVMYYDNKKMGKPILYNGDEDVAQVMSCAKAIEYREPFTVGPLTVTAHDAGHIFGSAFYEIRGGGKTVVFSGDVGNERVPILCDTESIPPNADLLVCESTYGDRLHEVISDRERLLEKVIIDGLRRGGTILIPSFALERTQELIYTLNDLIDRKKELPRVPIFLDSPLAIDAIQVYRKFPKYYDEEAERYFKSGDDLFQFPGFTLSYTREESMRINHVPGQKIVIAGAGMMTGGRILHHALRYLSDERSTLLMIGYQSHGSLGRRIKDGASHVEIFGERVAVNCKVVTIGGLSAHADQKKLISWITKAKPKHVVLNHGDTEAAEALEKILIKDHKLKVGLAANHHTVEI